MIIRLEIYAPKLAINVVVKGDVFVGYFDITGEFATGAPLRDTTSMKRAHFKLLK